MNKSGLIKKIAENTNLTIKDAANIVDQIISKVVISLQSDHKVRLNGFGRFIVVQRNARVFHNPKTGEKLDLKATKIAKFIPSRILKEEITDILRKSPSTTRLIT